jgi:predicted nucleic acid-binding Zn ribbon protein
MEGVEDMVKKPEGAAHISGILSGLLNSFRPETEQGMLRIWRVWDRIVGEDIAGNARPAAFKGSVLLVHVTSSSWLYHLRFLKKELVTRLNDDLGQPLVSDIKFKVGSF